MTVTRDQAQMLATLAAACRPNGAARWDSAGILAAIAHVKDRSLPEVCMAVIRAAADRDVDTPGVIPTNGSHWAETAAVTPNTSAVRKFDRAECCGTCSLPQAACRRRWAEDHDYEPAAHAMGRKGDTDVARTVAALKDELAPIAPPKPPRTFAGLERDPVIAARLDEVRTNLPGLAAPPAREPHTPADVAGDESTEGAA